MCVFNSGSRTECYSLIMKAFYPNVVDMDLTLHQRHSAFIRDS